MLSLMMLVTTCALGTLKGDTTHEIFHRTPPNWSRHHYASANLPRTIHSRDMMLRLLISHGYSFGPLSTKLR